MSEYNNTELAIIAAAEEVFFEKGYNAASTTRIAEKAGVTHAMLHYYFRSKERLFLKILDKEVDAMISGMRSVMSPGADVWDTLEKAIGLYYDFLDSHRRMPFLILNVADSNPEMLEKFKRRLMRMVNIEFAKHSGRFRKWIDDGVINDISPFQLLCTIVTMSISTFLGLPLFQNVMKMDEQQVSEYIRRRREETVTTVKMRLFAKMND